VGRSPDAGLRLDPEEDLASSSSHARLEWSEGRWWLRDLESRNGTFVDGERVGAAAPLRDGSRIRLGEGGPQVLVVSGAGTPGSHGDEETPTDRFQALGARVRRLRRVLVVVAFLVSVVALGVWGAWEVRARGFEAEREALLARMDAALASSRETIASLQGDRQGLARTLEETRATVEELRSALRAARTRGAGGGDLDGLQQRLQAATAALDRQMLAAELDVDPIVEGSRSAVARIYVDSGEGEVSTGTGFGVRADGTIVTNRHVVETPDGRRPRRIGIQYSGSSQVWPGRILQLDPAADLAALKIDNILGETPVIEGLDPAPEVATGEPVALLGFPLGGEPGFGEDRREVIWPLITVGVVLGPRDDAVEIQGYGEEGASGSPVFDGEGRLVGVVYGGRRAEGTLLAVPAPRVLAFLQGL
jgi:S1-C subfamily serine protease